MQPHALTELVDSAVRTGADIVSASVSFIEVRSPEEGWNALNKVKDDVDKGLIEVPAVTMSATLIKRRVLEKCSLITILRFTRMRISVRGREGWAFASSFTKESVP